MNYNFFLFGYLCPVHFTNLTLSTYNIKNVDTISFLHHVHCNSFYGDVADIMMLTILLQLSGVFERVNNSHYSFIYRNIQRQYYSTLLNMSLKQV